jgi:hypothetical protein
MAFVRSAEQGLSATAPQHGYLRSPELPGRKTSLPRLETSISGSRDSRSLSLRRLTTAGTGTKTIVAPISHEGSVSAHWKRGTGTTYQLGVSSDFIESKVQVLYDYEAKFPGVLSLREGDIALLHSIKDRGWCILRTDGGEEGYFPQSHVGALGSNEGLLTADGSQVLQTHKLKWEKHETCVSGNVCETWVERLNRHISRGSGMCTSCEELIDTVTAERAREIESLQCKHLQIQAGLRTQLKIEKQKREKSEQKLQQEVQREADRGSNLALLLDQAERKLQDEKEDNEQLKQSMRIKLEDKEVYLALACNVWYP